VPAVGFGASSKKPKIQDKQNTAQEKAGVAEISLISMNLKNRLLSYLGNGGLFNPELMEHDKVRDLMLDVLNEIRANEIEESSKFESPFDQLTDVLTRFKIPYFVEEKPSTTIIHIDGMVLKFYPNGHPVET